MPMKIDLTDLLTRAYDLGFLASSRGYNAEYPFSGDANAVSRELSVDRQEALQALLEAVTIEEEENG